MKDEGVKLKNWIQKNLFNLFGGAGNHILSNVCWMT